MEMSLHLVMSSPMCYHRRSREHFSDELYVYTNLIFHSKTSKLVVHTQQANHKHVFLILVFSKIVKNVLILRSSESVNLAACMISLYGYRSLIYDQSTHDLITGLIVIDIAPLTKLFCNCPLADL